MHITHHQKQNFLIQIIHGQKLISQLRLPQVIQGKKWELDSLASFLKLSYNYWYNTKDDSFLILDIMEKQQLGTMQEFRNKAYKFSRLTRITTETLMLEGIGNLN